MSLRLRLGPELGAELHGFPERLERSLRRFFAHQVVGGEARPADGTPLVMVCERGLKPSSGPVILDEPPLVVREDGSGLVLELPGISCWCEPARGEARLLLEDLDAVPVEHLTRWLIVAALFQLAQERGWIGLHAAAIVVDGRALVLPGPSGSGKSTIFRDACAAGHAGLSEDLIWVREGRDGFAAGAFRRGEEPAAAPGTPEQAAIAALVLPSIRDHATSELRVLPPTEAVDRLLRQASMLGSGATVARRFTSLVRLVAGVPCRALEAGRDRGATIRLLVDLAREVGSSPGFTPVEDGKAPGLDPGEKACVSGVET